MALITIYREQSATKIVFDLIRTFPYPVLPPVPSRKLIPNWFKKMKPLTSGNEKDERGERMRTVKKCVPFFRRYVSWLYVINSYRYVTYY